MGTAPPPRPQLLIVDDDPAVREALACALADRGILHTAATGEEACRTLAAHPIAAILLDVILGEQNGLDFVEQFRRLSAARIVILTGYSSEDVAIRAVWAGVDGYLKKPPSLPALRAALDGLLPSAAGPAGLATQVRHCLDEDTQKPFRADTLAARFGVSERHVRRRFRERYGETPRQRLLALRLRRVVELLHTTDDSVKSIALESGFPGPRALRRAFVLRLGATPRACRTRCGSKDSGTSTGDPCPGCPKVAPFCPNMPPVFD